MGIKSRTFDIPSSSSSTALNGAMGGRELAGGAGDKQYRVKLTDQERKKVEEMIRNAKSLQEITRLERELNEGRIP